MMEKTYREKTVAVLAGVLILVTAFMLLYEPWRLGEREFFRQEAFYAAQTLEMDRAMPLATAHGVAIQNAFPLYPLLGSLLDGRLPSSLEFNLRLLSVLMTALCAALIYLTVRSVRSDTAAQAATAMFIASNIVVEKSLDAGPATMIMFGLLAAQLVWFYLGFGRGNWNLAWVASLTVMAVVFYAGGFLTLFYFFFPLVFMRRPLTVWSKLDKPGLAVGLLVLAGVIAFWGMPYIVFSKMMPLQYWQPGDAHFGNYLQHFAEFPLYILLRFMPWVLLAWAPFCVALHPLDETPIFSRYLRTIVISGFFLLWAMPGAEAEDLLILAGPLSILTGLYYEAAVRRYALPVQFLIKVCGAVTLIAAALLGVFCLTPEHWLDNFMSLSLSLDFKQSTAYLIGAIVAIGSIVAIGVYILVYCRRRPVWLLLLLTSAALGVFYWTAMFPYRAQNRQNSRIGAVLGRALAAGGAKLAPDQVVYKSDIIDLYGECRYLNVSVRKIESLDDLPKAARTVFLLSTEFPQAPDRNWTNLLPPDLIYLRHRLCLWKGVLKSDRPEFSAPGGDRP